MKTPWILASCLVLALAPSALAEAPLSSTDALDLDKCHGGRCLPPCPLPGGGIAGGYACSGWSVASNGVDTTFLVACFAMNLLFGICL